MHKVFVEDMDDKDPFSQAVAALIWKAWKGGVRADGENMVIMTSHFEMGPTPEEVIDTGDWEIRVKKVSD